jgi:cytoskeleton protein RodZ
MTERSDAGDGVGEELARARAALGFTIKDVAQQLKFAARQIEALEQGRFEQLPTGTFARGMVRAYARLLKLDAEPLVQRIAAQTVTPDNAAAVASVQRPIPITDSTRRTNLIYAALSLAILVVIAGVVFEWQRERSGAAKLTFVAAAVQEPQRSAVASSVAAPNVVPLSQPEAPPPSVAEAVISPPARSTSDTGSSTGSTKRIVMKFDSTSWVEIRGRNGKVLTSQLNPGGTEQTIEGRPPFALVIGNAQHVRLSYDDKPVDLAPHVKVEVARFTLD